MRRGAVLLLFLSAALWPGEPAALAPLDEASFHRVVASAKGKVVLVSFWATWCAPCREEMPHLVRLESALRAKGFQLITVSADEPEDAAEAMAFLRKVGVPPPAYIKHTTNNDQFITAVDRQWSGALPASFLYDRKGRKVRSFIGEVDLKVLEAEIRKLL